MFIRFAALVLVLTTAAAGSAAPQRARAGGSIAGRVVDSAKAPLPGAVVTVRPLRGGEAKEVVCRSDGSYGLNGLAEDTYQVDGALEGFDITRRLIEVHGDAVTDVELKLDISMVCECADTRRPGAPAILQGVVTDGRGHPLPHVWLALSGEGVEEKGYTDAAGRFRARVPENRVYVLTTATPGFVRQRTTVRVREAARGAMTVSIELASDKGPGDYPDTARLAYPCSCPGDVFIHPRK